MDSLHVAQCRKGPQSFGENNLCDISAIGTDRFHDKRFHDSIRKIFYLIQSKVSISNDSGQFLVGL